MSGDFFFFLAIMGLIVFPAPWLIALALSRRAWSRTDRGMTLAEFRDRSIDLWGAKRGCARYAAERDPAILRCRGHIRRAVFALGALVFLSLFVGLPLVASLRG